MLGALQGSVKNCSHSFWAVLCCVHCCSSFIWGYRSMWSYSLLVFQKYFPKSLIGWKTSLYHSYKQCLSSYTALLSFCLDFGKEGRKQMNSIYPFELEVRESGLFVWWEPWPSGTCRCSEEPVPTGSWNLVFWKQGERLGSFNLGGGAWEPFSGKVTIYLRLYCWRMVFPGKVSYIQYLSHTLPK